MIPDTDTSEISNDAVLEKDQIPSEKDSDPDTTETDELAELQNELSVVKSEAKKNFELMLRTKAELENYKKRIVRDMNDLRKYSLESIMKELLSVVDNMERAIQSSENKNENTNSIMEGINLTLNEMIKVLEKNNVTSIKSVGKLFDPKIHQAMSQEETSKYPPNTVVKELLKGYLIHDRLLRPSMVIVSKKPEQKETEE